MITFKKILSVLSIFLVVIMFSPLPALATSNPTVMDTLPVTGHGFNPAATQSFSYTVPAGGQNKVTVVLYCINDSVTSMTLNTVSMTVVDLTSGGNRCAHIGYAYLAAPTSGLLAMVFAGATFGSYVVFTVQDAFQGGPEATGLFEVTSSDTNTNTVSVTTVTANDLVVDFIVHGGDGNQTYGASQVEIQNDAADALGGAGATASTYKAVAGTGSTNMVVNWDGGGGRSSHEALALKYAAPAATNPFLFLFPW